MRIALFFLGLAAALLAGAAVVPPPVVVSIIGTNDLHGRVVAEGDRGGLAVFGGYLANLRAERAREGGAVVLVDAGDAFQGTLESNPNEGAAVIRAMNRLGYAAMAVGNHDFDYGPIGPAITVRAPGDDPRGALLARAAEAQFPFLAANLADAATGRPIAWPHVAPTTIVKAAGIQIGIVGVTTEETLGTTMVENVRDLRMIPLVDAIVREAAALRAAGCAAVVVAAHAGGFCKDVQHPDDVSSCDGGEILKVARGLPAGAVDVIVAGHIHAKIAQRVNGIAIVESFSYGRAFGRVDLAVDRKTGRVASSTILPPCDVCLKVDVGTDRCDPAADRGRERVAATYAGAPVLPDVAVAETLALDVEMARALRARPLGVRVETRIGRAYNEESALGNLVADLMRVARHADVGLTNGGGLRAHLEPGPLTYGQLYEAYSFDNRFATLRVSGADLRRILVANLGHSHGILLVSGVRAHAHCAGGRLEVAVTRDDGRPVADDESLLLATSDFLAGGGEGAFSALGSSVPAATIEDELIREAIARVLEARGGVLRGEDLFDPAHPRIEYTGKRPIRCES